MSAILTFDAAATAQVDRVYSTSDVVAQRNATLEALSLREGDHVVDLGSGPGYLVKSMAEQVGPQGLVRGLDASESMIAVARQRCEDLPWVEFRSGDISALPFEDGEFDAAVCTQVYEYVADVDAALREAYRVIRGGGRLAVVDTDWESLVWASNQPGLADRILATWDEHLVDAHLPRTLRGRLVAAGFADPRVTVVPILNTTMANTYSGGMAELVGEFVTKHGFEAQEVRRWRDDMDALDADGGYFFSLNRYLFIAEKV